MQASVKMMEENEKKTLELLKTSKIPVSIGYVAFHLKITWQTSRNLLLRMALSGKISALETTKGYLFTLKTMNN